MTRDPQQEKVLEEVREFAQREIRPNAKAFEDRGGVSRELIAAMAAKGYLAAPFPKSLGGLGLDPEYFGLFTGEIGQACVATRSLITVHSSLVGETLIRWGTEEQKKKWIPKMAQGETLAAFALSEPEVGSDAKSIATRFEQKGDRFILNGKKKWITFGHLADLFVVIASRDGKSTAFLVERSSPGLVTKPIEDLMVSRGSYIAEIDLVDVEVPVENVLGRIDAGFEYVVSTALDYGRYSIAWGGVGIAQEALEAMVTYARTRSQFGEKLRSFQLIRGMIADATTAVHSARAIALRAGELRKNKDPDAIIETTLAKYFTSKVAVEVTGTALQVHGANGFSGKYPVERLFREAKVLEIVEGSSQIQQEMIAAFGMNRYYKRARA